MTARLEQLLVNATPGPWDWMHGYPQRVTNPEAILVAETFNDPDSRAYDVELIALAPDMARLLLDMGGTLREYDAQCECGTCHKNATLLARLDTLGKDTA